MGFNTALREQLKSLGYRELCHKHGHRSRGAAEAQMRSLERAQDREPDKKSWATLTVYRCSHFNCREAPWHVGHEPQQK